MGRAMAPSPPPPLSLSPLDTRTAHLSRGLWPKGKEPRAGVGGRAGLDQDREVRDVEGATATETEPKRERRGRPFPLPTGLRLRPCPPSGQAEDAGGAPAGEPEVGPVGEGGRGERHFPFHFPFDLLVPADLARPQTRAQRGGGPGQLSTDRRRRKIRDRGQGPNHETERKPAAESTTSLSRRGDEVCRGPRPPLVSPSHVPVLCLCSRLTSGGG